MDRRERAALAVWEARSKVEVIAFSPNGMCIASGHQDCKIPRWDAYSGASLGPPLQGHTGSIWSLAFSPNGGLIVSGSQDCTIRIWDRYSGTPVCHSPTEHTGGVRSVTFSPDGSRVVLGSDDWTTCTWDARDGTLLGSQFEGHTGGVRSVLFSPDGSYIVSSASDFTIEGQDAYNGAPLNLAFSKHTKAVLSTTFSPDGSRLLSVSLDGMVCVWDVTKSSMIHTLSIERARGVRSVAFSPDGTLIASGLSDRTIQVHDIYNSAPLGNPLLGHTDEVTSVAFSPNSARIASGSWDGTIRTWDTSYNATRQATSFSIDPSPFLGGDGLGAGTTFSRDGSEILIASSVNAMCSLALGDSSGAATSCRVWDLHSGIQLHPDTSSTSTKLLESHSKYHFDCTKFASEACIEKLNAEAGSILRIDDPQITRRSFGDICIDFGFLDGKIEVSGHPFGGHTRAVTSVALSDDRRYMVSGSLDCTVRLWDLVSRIAVGDPFIGHAKPVISVDFSPNNLYVVSKSQYDTIRIWQMPCRGTHGLQASALPTWHINDQGWIVDSTSLAPICWQPAELRDVLPRPPNILTISQSGCFSLHLHNLLLGESWGKCYQSS